MDNVINFPKGNVAPMVEPPKAYDEDTGLISKESADAVRATLEQCLEEGVFNLVMYAETKNGPVFVNLTENEDALLGKLFKVMFTSCAIRGVSEFTPPE